MRSLLAPALVALAGPTMAASFDCRAATHPSDIAIYRFEQLSMAEERYVKFYQGLIARGGQTAQKGKEIAAKHMVERRRCNGEPHCIREALASAESAMMDAVEADTGSSNNSGNAASRSWKSLEKIPTETLIRMISEHEDDCRASGEMLKIDRCDERNELYDYLKRMRGLCYGRDDESTFEYEWHECGPGSY